MPPSGAPPPSPSLRLALRGGVAVLLSLLLGCVAAILLLPPSLALPAVVAAVLVGGLALLLILRRGQAALDRADLLREAVDTSPLAYAATAPDGTLRDSNPAFADLAGDHPVLEAPHDVPEHDFDVATPEGRVLRVSQRRLSRGETVRFALDMTEARIRDLRARAIVDNVPAGIWHLDSGGRTISGNARLAALFGGAVPPSLLGSGLYQLGAAEEGGPFGLPPGREVEAAIPLNGGTGGERRILLISSPWLPGESGGREAVLTLLDISGLKTAQAQAAHYAYHDPLTGLPNRIRFQQALENLATSTEGGSLLLLDMAGIRAVNDRLGHTAGDALLREAAQRLRAQTRPGDEVFRVGGDEFGVIAPGARTVHSAGAVAGRMKRALATPFDLGAGPTPILASIGHAQAPVDARDPEELHRAAALALAQAKRDGGAIVSYTPALGERVARRLALRGQLVEAVNRGAFQLVWQPQVDARTRALRGAEALLRWPGGPGGVAVSPAEFLPEAVDAGLMPQIDAWVLDNALRQKREWARRPGSPAVVGVNISPATLRDPSFPDAVMASLSRHNVSPEELEVEIPEDVAARDLDAIAPVLHDLIGEGVRLSLDDFGGGLSALAHLLRLPVDQVKLDRSIVAGLPGGAREKAILRAVSALARGMEIPLLAEGVETEAQVEALLAEGCTVMQGWLFGRAVSADTLVPP
ncbi:putative bifunctional diguanylate cyclase/phosphodiesterase [Roseomonas sp. CCTCC AB2023176]|uniref:putative bifunctional diguanylate cyclase/phosphodiesterase n=1 Tax=Roseomonas sp. CCTCC AB2023176 TaxID=3342640 RepID=UPI0035D69E6D